MKQAINKLTQQLPDWMEKACVPGLSIALVDQGELIWTEGFGLADVATNSPVTTDTVFEAASLTKPFFATAVLQLVEENKLSLDTPVITYLPREEQQAERLFDRANDPEPYLFGYMPNDPRLHQLTTRHILSHQPGFTNWTNQGEPLRFFFTPGTHFSYSGDGYNLLQKIVACITSQQPPAIMQERLFAPLQMTRSWMADEKPTNQQIATKYDKEGKPEEPSNWLMMYAAASLQTTAPDYARFLLSLLKPDPTNRACLQPATIAQMWQPQVQTNTNGPSREDWPLKEPELVPDVAWGLGWGLQTNERGTAFWHSGDNGNFKAFTFGIPDEGTAVVMFANSINGDQLWRPILQTIFGDHRYPSLD
jgi:CubicO group peptidase (beta-lactamase class C family)